jgi:hypothetical protein
VGKSSPKICATFEIFEPPNLVTLPPGQFFSKNQMNVSSATGPSFRGQPRPRFRVERPLPERSIKAKQRPPLETEN